MTLLSIALLTLAGWPIRRALDPDARGARAAGESFLFGSGSAALLLFLMAACGIAWSRVSLLIGLGILAATAAALAGRRAAIPRETAPAPSGSRLWLLLDLATVMLVVAHVAFGALERPYEWDYFGIWGYKAHLFFETRSIPWPILKDPDYAWIQRGHPLFAPLLYSVGAIVKGEWQDRDLGLLITAFGVALILVVRGLVSEEHSSRLRRCLTTLAVAPVALSLWIGLAEGPLIAFGTSGILLIRRGLKNGDPGARCAPLHADSRRSIAAGAVLLGCAAMTKNEGTGLILPPRRRFSSRHEPAGRGYSGYGLPPQWLLPGSFRAGSLGSRSTFSREIWLRGRSVSWAQPRSFASYWPLRSTTISSGGPQWPPFFWPGAAP